MMRGSSASHGTVESQIAALASEFEEFQLALVDALSRGDAGWLRLSVRVENGKLTVCQRSTETSRDLRRQMGEGC